MFGNLNSLRIIDQIESFCNKYRKYRQNYKVVLCVPSTLIYYFSNKIRSNFVSFGAQNCHKNNKFGSDVVMHAIYLNGVKNLELWINIVGFSQPKFQNKILEWRETGQSIPKKKKKSPGRELNSRCMDSSTHSRDLLIA